MDTPFDALEYLYMGTADFARDLEHYRDVVKAEMVWAFNAHGAKVAAFRVAAGPLVLIADHRAAPSCMPVYSVRNLESAVNALRSRGWRPDGDVFEIPNGPAYRLTDPSGNQVAVFQNDHPNKLELAYADSANPRAIRSAAHL